MKEDSDGVGGTNTGLGNVDGWEEPGGESQSQRVVTQNRK